MEERKHCNKCNNDKSLTEFYKSKNHVDGLQGVCKECYKKYRRNINAMSKSSKRASIYKWKKTNKNHYPDPEFVWEQIENNITGDEFQDRLNKKYALYDHGNLGKKHRPHKQREKHGR